MKSLLLAILTVLVFVGCSDYKIDQPLVVNKVERDIGYSSFNKITYYRYHFEGMDFCYISTNLFQVGDRIEIKPVK